MDLTNKYQNGKPSDLMEEQEPFQFYAVGREDELIRCFKLIKRSGDIYAIPYALLPVLILSDNTTLTIRTHGIQIVVTGRNLSVIEEHLSNDMLLWITESPSGIDDEESPVFIKDIETGGEYLEI